MNRRQKIIVSVTGIFIVLLILLGLTYAYFLTRITGNGNPTSISVTTANLELVYGDGTTALLTSETPIEPGKFSSSKDFTVTNNGNALTDYAVTLEDFSITYANDTVINGQQVASGTVTKMEYPDDMKMTLTCTIESEVEERNGKECTNKITNGTLPTENSILLTNSVDVGDIHKYVLTLTYEDSGIDQSKDMNKTIRGKIDIIDPKSTIDLTGTVANYQAGDYAEINSTPIKSEIVDGKYKIIGVEPGSHTLYIKYKDANGDVQTRGSQTLTIKKGEEAKVNGNTIIFNDVSRTAVVDVETDYTVSVDENLINLFHNKTVREAIMSNSKIKKNYTTPDFAGVVEDGLYSAEDDYGNSWYFRGAIKDNYVKFAGFTWRIVRINGDGSVRLILDGSLDSVKREGIDVFAGTDSDFNSGENDNAYIGYMYGLAGTTTDANRCLVLVNGTVTNKISDTNYSTKELCETNSGKWTTTAYEATHANVKSSNIKNALDVFYETYIENAENNYYYGKYLADAIFCGDKRPAKTALTKYYTQKGYAKQMTAYAIWDRIKMQSSHVLEEYKPILKCAEDAIDNYSRYTVDSKNINGISTNGDLTYPIALLSADEGVLAGTILGNKNSYLSDPFNYATPTIGMRRQYYWTMTPSRVFNDGVADNVILTKTSYLSEEPVYNHPTTRPVINLRADVLISEGLGTYNEPFEISES